MGDAIQDFFGVNGFMPHGMCYLWQPGVLTLHVASDALITMAYFSIPFTLAHFVRRRKDIEFNWMIACFAIFIVACGTTHLMEILTIWHPVYWVSGAIKAITAVASVPTAVLLVRFMPQALRWPSPGALKRANDELQPSNSRLVTEGLERRRAQEEVQRINRELQEQLADMRRLHEMSTRLAHANELPKVLEEILDSTIGLQGASFGNLQLYDEKTSSLRIVAQRGFSQEFTEHFKVVQADDGLTCYRALQGGERVLIEDVEQDVRYAPYRAAAADAGYRAVQSTPILGRDGRIKGVLSTHFRQPRRLPETDLQLTDLYMRLAAELLERAQDEEAVRDARDAADRANRAKGRFLATASHDLRQPLQTISLLNGSRRRLSTDPDAMRAVTEQGKAIDTMSRVLNALLDISKLESGAITPQIRDFDLAASFDELRTEFSEPARNKDLQLEVSQEALVASSDPTLLGQMLRNLVSNAIRYTQKGVVRVRCEPEGERLRIDVQDTGIGIAQDQLTAIFDDFYQLGVAPNSVREGYGLGLSIVQRAAALLNHEVRVCSERGRGSTFSILLPAGSAGSVAKISAQEVTVTTSGHRAHVLVVDDEPGVLNATRMLLKVEGFRVSTADSLEEAISVSAEQSDIELLITDYHLSDGKLGTDVINAVRRVIGANLKAVLITGDTSHALKEAIRDDRVRLASKPINADEFLAVVDTLLES